MDESVSPVPAANEVSANQFPSAIDLPLEIGEARSARTQRLVRVAALGIAARWLVIAVELIGYWWLGHAVLLVDALGSTADVAASAMIIAAIKLAERPPDRDHPFGHGRYEPLVGLQLGVLIALLGVYLFVQQLVAAVQRPHAAAIHSLAWLIPALAAGLMEMVCRMVLWAGRREHSTALVAEAYHYRIDALTSLLAAVGLAVAAMLPAASALVDHLSAMLLAGIMIVLGLFACRENFHQLVDRVPDERWFALARDAAIGVAGVLAVEKVQIQRAGPDAHVNIDIEVAPECTVHAAHAIAQQVRVQIQTVWPAVRDVIVHVEPYYAGDH